MTAINHDDINKRNVIGQRIDNLIKLGIKAILCAKAYHKKNMPGDKDVMCIIDKLNTEKNHNYKNIEKFDTWTEQERIDLFARNREIIRGKLNENKINDVSFDFDITNPECLQDLGFACCFFSLWYTLFYDGIVNDTEALNILFALDNEISKRAYEAIGYWNAMSKKTMPYVKTQGKNSREIGQGNISRAKKVLKQCGGIKGYDKLVRGEKGKVIKEIEKAIIAKDERNVYNILNKIRKNK